MVVSAGGGGIPVVRDADGSLRAARFLAALPAGATGLFGMDDVLGLAAAGG